MSSSPTPEKKKKKKVLSSAKRVWKGITNTPRACLDTVVRYIHRQSTYPAKPCFLSGRKSQGKRSGKISMRDELEQQQRENPRSRITSVMREQQKPPEAVHASSSGTRVEEEDHSIFDDHDSNIKRNYYYKCRERFQLEKENSRMHTDDDEKVDDSIFEDFIQMNRERFRLEKENSLERLNYYALWPYYAYFDPDY